MPDRRTTEPTCALLVDTAHTVSAIGLVLADAELGSELNHTRIRQRLGARSVIPAKGSKKNGACRVCERTCEITFPAASTLVVPWSKQSSPPPNANSPAAHLAVVCSRSVAKHCCLGLPTIFTACSTYLSLSGYRQRQIGSNLRRLYRRLNGTIGGGWNNERGVIQAIEDYLGMKFNERLDFVTALHGWLDTPLGPL